MTGISQTTTARLMGPVLDRLRMAAADGCASRLMAEGVPERHGLTPRGMQLFAMLRNAYPARAVPVQDWRAIFTYLPPSETEAAFTSVLDAGLVTVSGDEAVLSDSGRVLMDDFFRVSEAAAKELWEGRDVSRPLALADRALSAALVDAGPTLAVVAPPYDGPSTSPAVRLAERLTGLRFSRFDSHIAAWTKAGASAATVGDLPADVRSAVEDETNERAGVPYSVLEPEERLELLGALAALRG